MLFTSLLRASKQKSRNVVVLLESMATGHKRTWWRERTDDKVQIVLRDPLVDMPCVYRETRKIKGVKYISTKQRSAVPKQEIAIVD